MTLCPQLRRLSSDHARWLAEGRRSGGETVDEQAERLLASWDGEMDAHCRAEEEILLPELARHLSETDAVVLFTLGDHVALRRLARELRLAQACSRPAALESLLEKLDDHFRFEERTLLPVLQERIGCDRLAQLGEELARHQARRAPAARPARGRSRSSRP